MIVVTPTVFAENIIDRITLAPGGIECWHRELPGFLAVSAAHGITDPDAIPDERARVLDDGGLLLYVCSPDGHDIGIKIPAGQWSAGAPG